VRSTYSDAHAKKPSKSPRPTCRLTWMHGVVAAWAAFSSGHGVWRPQTLSPRAPRPPPPRVQQELSVERSMECSMEQSVEQWVRLPPSPRPRAPRQPRQLRLVTCEAERRRALVCFRSRNVLHLQSRLAGVPSCCSPLGQHCCLYFHQSTESPRVAQPARLRRGQWRSEWRVRWGPLRLQRWRWRRLLCSCSCPCSLPLATWRVAVWLDVQKFYPLI